MPLYGYLGRTGLFEILLVSNTIKHLIIERAGEKTLQTAAMQEGMHTLAQSGIKKILQGITTPQELPRRRDQYPPGGSPASLPV
jgi:type II secretory ATPase GspE/PulE/Tfp pilus assembly ATPase PilB-like protein